MADIPLPTFTDAVDQSWFIEPLGGPSAPGSYLDRFPEEVYNKSPDSHLVRFMYTLLGPAGVGWLKQNLLEARLAMEEYGFEGFDLERFYADPFRFGRILDELYDEDPTGLLPRDRWDAIKARDEAYRNRAIDFMRGARLGNSPEGLRLVAQSGLGQNVDLVENYRYFFDIHSDSPLGLTYYGKTNRLEEFIIRPRPDVNRTEVQTIQITGDPTSGSFILGYNGQFTTNYTFQPVAATTAAVTLPVATVPVAHTGGFPTSGTFTLGSQTVTYTGLTETSFTGCTGGTGAFPSGSVARGVSAVYNNIPWNASPYQVETALRSLPNIGDDGARVTGGPLPNPYTVTFGGTLSNQDVALITAINNLIGGTDPGIDIETAQGGVDASADTSTISPNARHDLQTALDLIRPVASIPTLYDYQGLRKRQDWNTAFADSAYSEVVRFVTGSTGVNWPTLDSTHWIVKGIEKQAPRIKDDRQHHYVGFHNVSAASAYTDAALDDVSYFSDSSVVANYKSEKIGRFSPTFAATIPLLASQTDDSLTLRADRITADYAEPLTVTSQTGSTSLINGIYPSDYTSLSGVKQIAYKDEQYWASLERAEGTEYVELDLGSVQPVNYITCEILELPVDIEITYDALDGAPARDFRPVTPDSIAPYEDSLFYDPLSGNPWHYTEYHFTDLKGEMVWTRFIRLGITRRTTSTPLAPAFLFDPLTNVQAPWGVAVRNLRVGRNVNE
jgi:hypothetical protein